MRASRICRHPAARITPPQAPRNLYAASHAPQIIPLKSSLGSCGSRLSFDPSFSNTAGRGGSVTAGRSAKSAFPQTPLPSSVDSLVRTTDAQRSVTCVWPLKGFRRNSPYSRRSVFVLGTRPRPRPASPTAAEGSSLPAKNMLVTTTVVSTPGTDLDGAAVLLHFENRRYLIGNLPEGSQRLIIERKHALAKMEQVMLTGCVGDRTCGGLVGMILTMAGVVAEANKNKAARIEAHVAARGAAPKNTRASTVVSSLKLRGGDNLAYYLALARRFILRQSMPVELTEVLSDPRADDPSNAECDWEDENVKVWHLPLEPEGARGFKKRRTAAPRPSEDAPPSPSSPMDEDAADEEPRPALTDASRDLLRTVVTDMFASTWKLDALVEMRLHEVSLPATIFVRNKGGHLEKYTGPLPGSGREDPDLPVLTRRPWPAAMVPNLPPTSPSRTSMCYVVKLQSRRGKFDRAAADKLGIHPKDFKTLIAGKTITTGAGATVTPDMVLSSPTEGAAFAVVDVPSPSYVPALLSRPEWGMETIMKRMVAMYWILAPGLARDERLLAFMEKHSGIRHIVASPDVCAGTVNYRNAAALTMTHNRIDPDHFPLLHHNSDQGPLERVPPQPFVAARPGAVVKLSPAIAFEDDKALPPMDMHEPVQRLEKDPTCQKILDEASRTHRRVNTPEFDARARAADTDLTSDCLRRVEVTPLGTGSSSPSLYRNVSATLLRVPGKGSYLFDCGENTLGQIKRQFGPRAEDQYGDVVRDLRVVFISHIHADHHIGLVGLLRTWDTLTAASFPEPGGGGPPARRLTVVATRDVLEYVREYSRVQPLGNRLNLVTVPLPFHPSRFCKPALFAADEAEALGGLTRIDCVAVDHCFGALATAFTWGDLGLKVAFSGDCRPSPEFAKIGKGANLLIHESTFENSMQGDALAKKHCTMGEALGVARDMEARRVLLTHFSQRYPKVPNLDHYAKAPGSGDDGPHSGAEDDEMPVLFAFDHMSVRLGRFRHASMFLDTLRWLYENGAVIGTGPAVGEDELDSALPDHGGDGGDGPLVMAGAASGKEGKKKKQQPDGLSSGGSSPRKRKKVQGLATF